MKVGVVSARSWWVCGLICVCEGWLTIAAQAADPTAERARIQQERLQAESNLRQAQQDCSKRFVITPCVEEVRRQHRESLSNLKQQENLLNDLRRQQRATARTQALADTATKKSVDVAVTSPEETGSVASDARTPPVPTKPVRSGKGLTPERLATLEQERAHSQSSKDAQAARRAAVQREKLNASARRKAAVEERNAERARSTKPASPGLPSPGKPPAALSP